MSDYYRDMFLVSYYKGRQPKPERQAPVKPMLWCKFISEGVFAIVNRRDENHFEFTFPTYAAAYEYAKHYVRSNPHWEFAYL